MAILFIIMLLAWAVLAFAPSYIERAVAQKLPPEENLFVRKFPFLVPTFSDFELTKSGVSSARPFALDQNLEQQQTPNQSHGSIRHITFMPPELSITDAVSRPGELTILDRDFVLKQGRHFAGNISVNGSVRIETDASFSGNITCSGHVVVSQSAAVDGDIDCKEDIRIEAHARVNGSLTTDGNVWIYENAKIGETDAPSNIRAREVVVAPNSRVHGSIWARRNGIRMTRTRAA